jgi:hypothetical protein
MELPKSKLSKQPTKGKQQAECAALLTASCWLPDLLFYPEDGGSKFFQNMNFKQTTLYHSPEEIICLLYGLFQFLF